MNKAEEAGCGMKEKLIVIGSVLISFLNGFSQQVIKQENVRYTKPLEVISIVGHVYDQNHRPLPGIKVEIRLAYSLEQKGPEIAASEGDAFNDWEYVDWNYLIETLGTTEVFASVETDKKGIYRIPGIPFPGAYFLLVRRVENYYPARVPLLIPKTGAKEFGVDIALKAVKPSSDSQNQAMKSSLTDKPSGQATTSSSPQRLSKPALNEIVAAKKAMQSNKIDKAIEHFQKAIEIDPEFGEAHYNLGGLLRQKGRMDEAVGHFEQALKIKQDYPLALFYLGDTLHAQKKHSESNVHLIKFLKASSGEETKLHPQAYFLVGANHCGLKQAEEAIPFLLTAIELNPSVHPNAYIFLGNSYMLLGDRANAVKYFKKFLELYPDASNIRQVKDILEKLESMAEKKK